MVVSLKNIFLSFKILFVHFDGGGEIVQTKVARQMELKERKNIEQKRQSDKQKRKKMIETRTMMVFV
jgi:hypothetical protein